MLPRISDARVARELTDSRDLTTVRQFFHPCLIAPVYGEDICSAPNSRSTMTSCSSIRSHGLTPMIIVRLRALTTSVSC